MDLRGGVEGGDRRGACSMTSPPAPLLHRRGEFGQDMPLLTLPPAPLLHRRGEFGQDMRLLTSPPAPLLHRRGELLMESGIIYE